MAADRLAERARTARLLSTDWNDEYFNTFVTRINDCCAIGKEMTDEAGVDRRLIATHLSEPVFLHDYGVTTNADAQEMMFYGATFGLEVMDILKSLHWADTSGLNVLSWPGAPSVFWEDDVESGNNNVYFLNDFSLHVLEKYYQSDSSPFADPSSIQYGAVDYSELHDGSLDGFFDIVTAYLPDLHDYTYETINGIVRCLKPGGLMTIRQMAPRVGFYYTAHRLHNYWDHDYSKLLADHPDLVSRHFAWSTGVVFATKKTT